MAAMSRSSAPSAGQLLIALEGVSVAQAEHVVVSDVHLEVKSGEFVYLIGKTGSGKSSLLRALYGDLPLQAGTGRVCDVDLASVNRRNVHQLRRLIGIVFQDFALLPDRSVYANLDFVLRATGWNDKAAIDERIADCLKAVGLGPKGYKMPHQLSGGEQQRVAIARALLNSPALILADEPTGNLDPETTEEILSLLHGLVRENRSVLMATHDHDALRRHPGRLIRCEKGRIEEEEVAGLSRAAASPPPAQAVSPPPAAAASPPPAPLKPEKSISHAAPTAPPADAVEPAQDQEIPAVAFQETFPDEGDDDAQYEWDDQDDALWDSLPGTALQGHATLPEHTIAESPEPLAEDAPEDSGVSDDGAPPPSPPSPSEGLPPGIQFRLNR